MTRATTRLVNSVRVRAAPALQQTGKHPTRRGAHARTSASLRAAAAAAHRLRVALPTLDTMGAICGKVETQGESRKEVEEDLRIDNRKRNSLIFAVIEWVTADREKDPVTA